MSWLRRMATALVVVLLVLGLGLAALILISVRRGFPQTVGEVQLAGLQAPVDVYRDAFGVPHLYASSERDLFFAQGYVHAQDRFWQMDFWRHQGAGRLAQLLGENALSTDIFLRTMGWERIARQELAALDQQTLSMLQAYAEGVNAYLADHQGTALGLEYLFLPVINPGYEPQPWEPLNTLTWAKAMAWDLRGNMGTELDRARLLKVLSPEQVDQLYPAYPADRPVIVRSPHLITGQSASWEADPALFVAAAPALEALGARLAALAPVGLPGPGGLGSNSWALSGALTDTGTPLLANDPHLAVQMPSIWYEVGLHCLPRGPECALDVVGFSFAGAPGVVIGHNDRIAWGLTNTGPDVMDLYIEKINPQNPDQYEFLGEWIDMQVLTEELSVAGGETVELKVQLTHHGPLITEAFGLEDLADETGLGLPEPYAIALRWTSLEPNNTFRAIFNFNRAQNWQEFRQAAREFAVPSQNLLYADVDGNIGYQMPGNIPLRSAGHSGMEPVPGWTGEYEWLGYIPFDELPFTFNPPEGYIVTANNAVVGSQYPHTISREWDYGLRAQRIVEMIEAAPGPLSREDMQRMQGDNRDLNADLLLPYLLGLPLEPGRLAGARQLLVGWDVQAHMDSAPAALFAAFWKHLVAGVFGDELPGSEAPSGNDRWMQVLRPLLEDPDNAWWDDVDRPGTQTRDDILRLALSQAVDELEGTLGSDPAGWTWGDLHTVTFRHRTMDNLPLVNGLFNRGPFRASGGGEIVNATGWSASGEGYGVGSVPSMRMVVDLGELGNSVSMHTTGQSGHPYQEHYIDMADPWREIRYHPMLWDRTGVEAAAEAHLRLVP